MLNKRKIYIFLFIILVLFFTSQFFYFRVQTQSFKFGDESEHLAPGWMMAKFNTKLYKDITTNHQPIPIIASQLIFKTMVFSNLSRLIETVRFLMFMSSILGATILVSKFKFVGLISVILVETIKFWLFGYHLLAESIVLYPVMFIMATITELLLWKNHRHNILDKYEPLLFGLSVFLVGFSLLPCIPFLIITSVIYLHKTKYQNKVIMLVTTLALTLLLFLFIDINGWFKYTVVDNIKYFVPYENETRNFKSYLILLIYPFQSFLNYSVPVAKYYLFLTIMLIVSIIIVLKNSKALTLFIKVALLYLLVIILNLRISKIDIGFYTAFHVLPQLGAFTILTTLLITFSLEKSNVVKKQKIFIMILYGILIAIILFFNTAWWREVKNKSVDHFIQYSETESMSSAFKALKLGNDKLLVGELDGLLNIASDIPIAGAQNAYLEWSYQSAESRQKLINLMTKNPPTFIVFPAEGPYFNLIKPYLSSNYTRLQRFDGSITNAYMLNSEIPKRSKNQWREFENALYKLPDGANI